MSYKELVESGSSVLQEQPYLTNSELVTVAIRLLRAMRDAIKEHAALNDMKLTALVKQRLVAQFTRKG